MNSGSASGGAASASGAQSEDGRIWPMLPMELADRIVSFVPPNEQALVVRLVNRAAARHFRGPAFTTIRMSQPVPPAEFAWRWGRPGATRTLSLKLRRKLICLAASSGVVANLELASKAAGCLPNATALEAAAASGHVSAFEFLRLQDLGPLAGTGALAAAAGAGQRALVAHILDSGIAPWSWSALHSAAHGGHAELLEWLMARCPDVGAAGGAAVGSLGVVIGRGEAAPSPPPAAGAGPSGSGRPHPQGGDTPEAGEAAARDAEATTGEEGQCCAAAASAAAGGEDAAGGARGAAAGGEVQGGAGAAAGVAIGAGLRAAFRRRVSLLLLEAVAHGCELPVMERMHAAWLEGARDAAAAAAAGGAAQQLPLHAHIFHPHLAAAGPHAPHAPHAQHPNPQHPNQHPQPPPFAELQPPQLMPDSAPAGAIVAAAAASPTRCWRSKVAWLLARGYPRVAYAAERAAARPDAVERLTWLRAQGFPADATACQAAARTGNLAALQLLVKDQGVAMREEATARDAAAGGHLQVLRWLAAEGRCPVSSQTAWHAARGGHLHVLRWLVGERDEEEGQAQQQQEGCAAQLGSTADAGGSAGGGARADTSASSQAAASAAATAADGSSARSAPTAADAAPAFAHPAQQPPHQPQPQAQPQEPQQPQPQPQPQPPGPQQPPQPLLTASVFSSAAMSGSVALLTWLRQRGCPWDDRTFPAAVCAGSAEGMAWLHQQGAPLEEDVSRSTYTRACRSRDLSTLQALRDLGFPLPAGDSGRDLFIKAIRDSAGLAVLRWLVGAGCRVDWEAAASEAARWEPGRDVRAWLAEKRRQHRRRAREQQARERERRKEQEPGCTEQACKEREGLARGEECGCAQAAVGGRGVEERRGAAAAEGAAGMEGAGGVGGVGAGLVEMRESESDTSEGEDPSLNSSGLERCQSSEEQSQQLR